MTPTAEMDEPVMECRWRRIEAKLVAAKERLATAGYVAQRQLHCQQTVWVVRYRDDVDGKRRHRAIYLGPEVFAERAKALIRRWRAEAVNPEDRRRRSLLGLFDIAAVGYGYSGRARHRLRAAAEETFGDAFAEWRFVLGMRDDVEIARGKRPGRPAKSGLW